MNRVETINKEPKERTAKPNHNKKTNKKHPPGKPQPVEWYLLRLRRLGKGRS